MNWRTIDYAAPVDPVLAPSGSLDNAIVPSDSSSPIPAEITTGQLSSPSVSTAENALGRGMREKYPSVLLKDFVTHTL
ncbi:unnamed protein product [Amaranthus hypochondriacus]